MLSEAAMCREAAQTTAPALAKVHPILRCAWPIRITKANMPEQRALFIRESRACANNHQSPMFRMNTQAIALIGTDKVMG
jgi:hypothetical protein